jgi:hypothetical protein
MQCRHQRGPSQRNTAPPGGMLASQFPYQGTSRAMMDPLAPSPTGPSGHPSPRRRASRFCSSDHVAGIILCHHHCSHLGGRSHCHLMSVFARVTALAAERLKRDWVGQTVVCDLPRQEVRGLCRDCPRFLGSSFDVNAQAGQLGSWTHLGRAGIRCFLSFSVQTWHLNVVLPPGEGKYWA